MAGFLGSAETHWLWGFTGLNDSVIPGASKLLTQTQIGPATVTGDLRNVRARFGIVRGRGGLAKYQSVATPMSTTPIIGLGEYIRHEASNVLVRMSPTKLEWLNGSTWTDITGTALTGTSLTRPQFDTIQDTLVFVNEGEDRPRKWLFGAASSATLGGTPPFAKSLAAYVGYLILGNISNDGTFTDVLHGWRAIQWSSDYDNTWVVCASGQIGTLSTLEVNATPAELLRMMVMGRRLMAYKADGLVWLTWVGGVLVFRQDKVPVNIGLAGPLAVADVGEIGHILLANDAHLYLLTESTIKVLSPEALVQTLPTVSTLARFRYSRAYVLDDQDLFVLLYDRTGLSGQFLDSFVSYNYRTGEFDKGRVGKSLIAALGFRPTNYQKAVGLVGSNDLVYEMDSATASDDDGVTVDRYWTTGWQQFAGEEGWFYGARLIFKKSLGARVVVSYAKDLNPRFRFHQTFQLIGNSAEEEIVELQYIPPAIRGSWFNVKVALHHDRSASSTELMRVGIVGEAKLPVKPAAAEEGKAVRQ